MPDYTVAAGLIAAHNATVTAGQVTTVTFREDLPSVDVIADGSTDVYYTLDGSAPTIAGAHTYRLPVGAMTIDTRQPNTSGPTVVRLIASVNTVVSVQRGD